MKMNSSFSKYRDQTGVESDSGSEVIDNSLVVEDSFTSKKKLPGKNQTVFVAESEESYTEDESEEESIQPNVRKNVLRESKSHVVSSSEDDASRRGSSIRQSKISFNNVVVSSSDEGASRRGSSRRQSKISFNNVVVSSSDEGDVSPEILPKRRPPMVAARAKSNSSSEQSFIGRKKNKRMILIDSDTENSIVIEHEKHKKLTCLKDTPLKIDDGNKCEIRKATLNTSVLDQSDGSDSEDDEICETDDAEVETNDARDETDDPRDETDDAKDETNDTNNQSDYENDGPDEDQMVMSRATRMSIMGMIPKDDHSDESDFIQSDETSRGSSPAELPDTNSHPAPKTPTERPTEAASDTSRVSCSPFSNPLQELINEPDRSKVKRSQDKINDERRAGYNDDVVFIDSVPLKPKLMNSLRGKGNKENVIDDDVTIIDTKPEVIALSSDDEEDQPTKKSPNIKKSPKTSKEEARTKQENTLRQYLAPPSYPNQVVYVRKHVRENELGKLERLKSDLHDVKHLLDNMDVTTLPDGGVRLIERLTKLEQQVRAQGDRVASMVVEPDVPTARDMANDGFDGKEDKGLSWEDLQKASNAVQPRMFGKQAMATHMAERNLILDRLRDLHASQASRPPEAAQAAPPRALRTALMPHQLHALAWLRWRETQRPAGGILADDMGLGKTITMISLVLADKEANIEHDDDDDEDRGSSKLSRGGTLVVCPASLMQQWGGEVSKHCAPHALSVCLHHGAARATHAHRLAATDVVITTYNILQRDNEKNGVLMKVLWRRVILDEAHIVRNHKSATSAAVSALRGRRRWCLTGTPVQNKDLDLFALLKFLRCTPFDELTMWKKWIDNKSSGGQERLNTVMGCILLRRTKLQLQQRGQLNCLPEREAHHTEVKLTKEEMNVYQKVLVFSKTLFAQFLHQRAEKQAFAGGDGFLAVPKSSAYDQMHKKMIALQGAKPVKSHEILVLLLRLRQVCCHCGLIAAMLDEETAGDDVNEDEGGRDLLAELNKLSLEDSHGKRKSGEKGEEAGDEEGQVVGGREEGTTVTEAIRSVLSPNNPVFQLERMSSKIRAVMHCLRENVLVNKGDKAVVVSQWTSVLRLVDAQLKKERVRSVTLSGAVPVPARPPLIQAINDPSSDVRVMLLSLCAGGVGLNLCGANHLLLLDPHWNPQLEEQAQDRIYRVGQTKRVHIYRFMCVDTVEQSIRKLQQAKLELAENVLTGAKNNNASKLTIQDLRELFNMG